MIDATHPANDGLALAPDVPGKTDSRFQIHWSGMPETFKDSGVVRNYDAVEWITGPRDERPHEIRRQELGCRRTGQVPRINSALIGGSASRSKRRDSVRLTRTISCVKQGRFRWVVARGIKVRPLTIELKERRVSSNPQPVIERKVSAHPPLVLRIKLP